MSADPARAFHHNVRNELTCLAQFNLRTDPAVRPYCAGGMDLGAWIDDGCRMNAGGAAPLLGGFADHWVWGEGGFRFIRFRWNCRDIWPPPKPPGGREKIGKLPWLGR